MEMTSDRLPLTPPRIYLIRMAVFLVLAGFIAFILYRQIWEAFLANPGLNALILGVMVIGIILAVRQVWRLFPEVRWVNALQAGDEAAPARRPPVLLAPMAALIHNRSSRAALSVTTTPLAPRFHRRAPGREPGDRALSRGPAGLSSGCSARSGALIDRWARSGASSRPCAPARTRPCSSTS
jgi:hypothetical protein